MEHVVTAEELRQAFVDLLDGTKGPHEIHEQTGLPMDRCQRIYDLFLLASLGPEIIFGTKKNEQYRSVDRANHNYDAYEGR